eukprot:Em0016g377a
MPVFKLPVRHKFGILPLTRAKEILARRNQAPKVQRENTYKAPRLEINSAFVTKYNESCESDRRRLDEVLRRELLYAKFKTKMKSPSTSHDDELDTSDVQTAWMELAAIGQCSGPFEEEALVALATSLAQAPLCPSQVPSLLYIAGLSYKWLKRDEVDGPLLRSGELLLLKILYLASLRIYVYHLPTDSLPALCTREEIEQLKSDIEGFENRERTYRNFPEALLHWKVALEVGLMVCENFAHLLNDPALLSASSLDNPECSDVDGCHQNVASQPNAHKGHSSLHPTLWHALDVWQCVRQGSSLLEESLKDLLACSTGFDGEHWMESMLAMDILCAAAEVNIKVLHFVQDLADGRAKESYEFVRIKPHPSCESAASQRMPSGLEDDQGNGRSPKRETRFATPVGDSRMDDDFKETSKILEHPPRTPITLNILGMQPNFKEGTTTDLSPMNPEPMPATSSKLKVTFMNWETPGKAKPCTPAESMCTQSLIEDESIPNTPVSVDSSSTDVDLHKSHSPSSRADPAPATSIAASITARHGRSSAALTAGSYRGTVPSAAVSTPMEEKLQSLLSPSAVGPRGNEDDAAEGGKSRKGESRCTHYTHSVAALSGGWEGGGRGSQLPPSTVCAPSFVSLPQAFGSEEEGGELRFNSRFESWPSEVCMTYTVNMASIAIYGQTSAIQDTALNGRRGQETAKHGLVQLARFQSDRDDQDFAGFPSWAVRFVAILGLSRVSRVCSKMNLKDGVSAVAWTRLMEAHSVERDKRVMEAYKLRQVSVGVDSSLLQLGCQRSSLPVITYIADTLSQFFLPSVTPITTHVSRRHHRRRRRRRSEPISCSTQKASNVSATLPKVDTGLNGGPPPLSPPSYIARTTHALQSVAEEHWRRQMSLEHQEQEKTSLTSAVGKASSEERSVIDHINVQSPCKENSKSST